MVFPGGRWFGTPKPIADESFLSWFRRTAAANALTPRELYRIAMPSMSKLPTLAPPEIATPRNPSHLQILAATIGFAL